MLLPNIAYPMTGAQRAETLLVYLGYAACAGAGILQDPNSIFTFSGLIVVCIALLVIAGLQKLIFRDIKKYPKSSLPELSRKVAELRHEAPLGPLWQRAMNNVRFTAIFIGAYILVDSFIWSQGESLSGLRGPFTMLGVIAWAAFTVTLQRVLYSFADYARAERQVLGVV